MKTTLPTDGGKKKRGRPPHAFAKGNTHGNRFSKDNQPQRRAFRSAWAERLAEMRQAAGIEPITLRDFKDTINMTLAMTQEEARRVVADKDKEPIIAVVMAASMLADIKKGSVKETLSLAERLYGKVEEHIVLDRKSDATILAENASDEELIAAIKSEAVGDVDVE